MAHFLPSALMRHSVLAVDLGEGRIYQSCFSDEHEVTVGVVVYLVLMVYEI